MVRGVMTPVAITYMLRWQPIGLPSREMLIRLPGRLN